MKIVPILTLIATAASFLPVPQAKANDEGKALIGGLIGGIIIGTVLADDNPHIDAAVTVGFDNHRHGYYKWVSVKTWNPGYHERRHDRCGRIVRVWVPGHYSYNKQKVWVAGNGRHDFRPSRPDHHDRYDHRNRYDRRDDNRHGDNGRDGRDRGNDNGRRGNDRHERSSYAYRD